MTREEALAKYLEVSVDTIEPDYSSGRKHVFTCMDEESEHCGDTFLVLTEDEAENEAYAQGRSLFEDLGIGGYTKGFQEFILGYCLDEDAVIEQFGDLEEEHAEALDQLEEAHDSYDLETIVELADQYDVYLDLNSAEDPMDLYEDIKREIESLIENPAESCDEIVDILIERYGKDDAYELLKPYVLVDKVIETQIRDGGYSQLIGLDVEGEDLEDGYCIFKLC